MSERLRLIVFGRGDTKFASVIPAVEARVRVDGLSQYRVNLELDLARLCEDEERAVWESLELTGDLDDDAERSIALGLLEERSTVTYPNLYRGAFLLIAWGHLEDTVRAIAELLRTEFEVDGSLRQMRVDGQKESFVDAAQRYFRDSLDAPLTRDVTDLSKLQARLAVRNAFAHDGGVPKKKRRQDFRDWAASGIGPEFDDLREVLILSAGYVKQVTDLIATVVLDLAGLSEQVVQARLRR